MYIGLGTLCMLYLCVFVFPRVQLIPSVPIDRMNPSVLTWVLKGSALLLLGLFYASPIVAVVVLMN